jgi:site-specific recombinase XerD
VEEREAITDHAVVVAPEPELARPKVMPFDAGADVFLSTLAGKTQRTRESYGHALAELFAWLEERGIEGVNAIRPIDLVDYRNWWADREQAGEHKASTIAKRLVAVRRFLERMAAEGFLHPRINRDFIRTCLASPKGASGKLPAYLERGEIQALLSVITDRHDRGGEVANDTWRWEIGDD